VDNAVAAAKRAQSLMNTPNVSTTLRRRSWTKWARPGAWPGTHRQRAARSTSRRR
jgi:hypothetical protein